MNASRLLAVSMGDPAGIGGEIIAMAWRALRQDPAAAFFAIDDPARFAREGVEVAEISHPSEAAGVFAQALPILAERLPSPPQPSVPQASHAHSVVRSIERGVKMCLDGQASGLVTAPINKKALKDGAQFAFPGHTEFLGRLCNVEHQVMMLAGQGLRVVPVTIHIPLAAAPAMLTADLIKRTARITHKALQEDFGVGAPRLAVAGLNPHAGEQGAMGREEIEVISPALEQLRAEGIEVYGPSPADTMFHPHARAKYDAALCMYHDQALIPLKTLAFDEGVNITLGLPIVRTSPDHGVAYDIAGQGRANAQSMIQAIRCAANMAAARAHKGADAHG